MGILEDMTKTVDKDIAKMKIKTEQEIEKHKQEQSKPQPPK